MSMRCLKKNYSRMSIQALIVASTSITMQDFNAGVNAAAVKIDFTELHQSFGNGAENGGYPPTQNGDIRSLFWLFSLMALQN